VQVVRPKSKRAYVIGALWRLPIGTFLLLLQIGILEDAIVGDGWLRLDAVGIAYWAVWALIMFLAVRLVYRGIRYAMSALRPPAASR
jgi:hypothetical protein